jgi:hypothetical protein
MNRYIIKINPEHKDILKNYGTIIFDSKVIDGLIGLESELTISKLRKIPYIIKIEKDRVGSFEMLAVPGTSPAIKGETARKILDNYNKPNDNTELFKKCEELSKIFTMQ